MATRPGAKRKTPITLPDIRGIYDPLERVRLTKLRQRLRADPKYYPAVTPVGELPPEQTDRLTTQGNRVQLESEFIYRGRERTPTGLQRRRIVGQVEQLRKLRGDAITVEQLAAAQAFQNCVAKALMSIGPLTMSYEPRFIDAPPKPELFAAERAVAHQSKLKAVYLSVDARHHFILDWLKSEVTLSRSYIVVAHKTWPNLSERYAESKFRRRLKETLDILISVFWEKSSKYRGLAENNA